MQSSAIMRKFALLTRQELAYVSGELPQLTNTQKSELNYKIKKKLEILEKIDTVNCKSRIRTNDPHMSRWYRLL